MTKWASMTAFTEQEAKAYLTGEKVNMSEGRAEDSLAGMKDGAVIVPVEDERMWLDTASQNYQLQRKN